MIDKGFDKLKGATWVKWTNDLERWIDDNAKDHLRGPLERTISRRSEQLARWALSKSRIKSNTNIRIANRYYKAFVDAKTESHRLNKIIAKDVLLLMSDKLDVKGDTSKFLDSPDAFFAEIIQMEKDAENNNAEVKRILRRVKDHMTASKKQTDAATLAAKWLGQKLFRPAGVTTKWLEFELKDIRGYGIIRPEKELRDAANEIEKAKKANKGGKRELGKYEKDMMDDPPDFTDDAVQKIYVYVSDKHREYPQQYPKNLVSKWEVELRSRQANLTSSVEVSSYDFDNLLTEYVTEAFPSSVDAAQTSDEDGSLTGVVGHPVSIYKAGGESQKKNSDKDKLTKGIINDGTKVYNECLKLIKDIKKLSNDIEKHEKEKFPSSRKDSYQGFLDSIRSISRNIDNTMERSDDSINFRIPFSGQKVTVKANSSDLVLSYHFALIHEINLQFYSFLNNLKMIIETVDEEKGEPDREERGAEIFFHFLRTLKGFNYNPKTRQSDFFDFLTHEFSNKVLHAVSGMKTSREFHQAYLKLTDINSDSIFHNELNKRLHHHHGSNQEYAEKISLENKNHPFRQLVNFVIENKKIFLEEEHDEKGNPKDFPVQISDGRLVVEKLNKNIDVRHRLEELLSAYHITNHSHVNSTQEKIFDQLKKGIEDRHAEKANQKRSESSDISLNESFLKDPKNYNISDSERIVQELKEYKGVIYKNESLKAIRENPENFGLVYNSEKSEPYKIKILQISPESISHGSKTAEIKKLSEEIVKEQQILKLEERQRKLQHDNFMRFSREKNHSQEERDFFQSQIQLQDMRARFKELEIKVKIGKIAGRLKKERFYIGKDDKLETENLDQSAKQLLTNLYEYMLTESEKKDFQSVESFSKSKSILSSNHKRNLYARKNSFNQVDPLLDIDLHIVEKERDESPEEKTVRNFADILKNYTSTENPSKKKEEPDIEITGKVNPKLQTNSYNFETTKDLLNELTYAFDDSGTPHKVEYDRKDHERIIADIIRVKEEIETIETAEFIKKYNEAVKIIQDYIKEHSFQSYQRPNINFFVTRIDHLMEIWNRRIRDIKSAVASPELKKLRNKASRRGSVELRGKVNDRRQNPSDNYLKDPQVVNPETGEKITADRRKKKVSRRFEGSITDKQVIGYLIFRDLIRFFVHGSENTEDLKNEIRGEHDWAQTQKELNESAPSLLDNQKESFQKIIDRLSTKEKIQYVTEYLSNLSPVRHFSHMSLHAIRGHEGHEDMKKYSKSIEEYCEEHDISFRHALVKKASGEKENEEDKEKHLDIFYEKEHDRTESHEKDKEEKKRRSYAGINRMDKQKEFDDMMKQTGSTVHDAKDLNQDEKPKDETKNNESESDDPRTADSYMGKKKPMKSEKVYDKSFEDLQKEENWRAEKYGKDIWNSVSRTVTSSNVFRSLGNEHLKNVAHQVLLDLHKPLSEIGKLNPIQQSNFSKLFLLNNQTFFKSKIKGFEEQPTKLKDNEHDIWSSMEDKSFRYGSYEKLPEKIKDNISKETYDIATRVTKIGGAGFLKNNQKKNYTHLITALGSSLDISNHSVNIKMSDATKQKIMSEFGKRISYYIGNILKEDTNYLKDERQLLRETVANIRWRRNPRTHLNKVIMTCKTGQYKKSLNKDIKVAGQKVKEVMCLPISSKPASQKAKDRKSSIKRWRKIKANPGKMTRSKLKRNLTKKYSKTLR